MAANLITTLDEFQEEYQKTVGQVLPHRPSKQANLDNIRRFGDGAGDYNPLWRDEEHAAKSRFGMITAPPPFIYGVALGVVAGETGGIERSRVSTQYLPLNYAGAEIDFVRPIWVDDTITCQEQVGETIRKHSQRIGPIAFNTANVNNSSLTSPSADNNVWMRPDLTPSARKMLGVSTSPIDETMQPFGATFKTTSTPCRSSTKASPM